MRAASKEIIKHRIANEVKPIWNLLRKSRIHERLKVNLWRMVIEVLLIRKQIVIRLGHEDSMCGFHGEGWNRGKINLLGIIKRFNLALEEFIMLKATEKQQCSATSSSNFVSWIPPPTGWIKVNMDVTHSERGSVAAMVVRNEDGKLLLLSSTLTSCRSSFEAEFKALNWVAAFAEARNWKQVCWEVDVMEVVKTIKATKEPTNCILFPLIVVYLGMNSLENILSCVLDMLTAEQACAAVTHLSIDYLLLLMDSCGKFPTLSTNPLLLVGKRVGERCSRSSNKRRMQKDLDRISQLPEEILVLILCWLSVDEAARTSVLSRRWGKLWMRTILATPRLEFNCMKKSKLVLRHPSETSDSERYEYANLVNKATKLHTAPTLEEFAVAFPFNSKNSKDIDRWVEFAAEKQVKKLKLDFSVKVCHDDDSYNGFLASQESNKGLYRLRDLYLRGVDVVDKAMSCVFSSSPFLERLCVIGSRQLHILEVASPNLNYLEIIGCKNLQLLNISAPNLRKIKLILGEALLGIDSVSAPDLSHVSLYLRYMSNDIFGLFNCIQNLLERFSQVKKKFSLRLSCDIFCEIARIIDLRHQFPELSNVEHLKLSIMNPWPWWYFVGLEWAQGLLWPCALVKAAPLLHKLSIELIHRRHQFAVRHFNFKWMDEDIPEKVKAKADIRHSHRHLKVVELVGFTGCRNDIELVLHLLEIAVSLEKVIISVCLPSSSEHGHIMRYEENPFAEQFQQCAQLLKKTRPDFANVYHFCHIFLAHCLHLRCVTEEFDFAGAKFRSTPVCLADYSMWSVCFHQPANLPRSFCKDKGSMPFYRSIAYALLNCSALLECCVKGNRSS
ncbi:hypothetical protein FNV43_RR22848 [Rhamnella rubrinervis]|uniref:F-box domain-containing protein n=1 Tax=Rhamnella rubrinervis TaxID=2594499 RepID=A0A8K0DS97_9ROSA|nr:hypothetical protein FNV43_RR22848 [Rhamnella rubrinervis]